MAYNAFLGQPILSKFMVIPHYAYLVLKMPGLRGVISIRGDAKHAYDYDKESCETVDKLMASVQLQDLAGLGRVTPGPNHARGQDRQDVHPVEGLTQQNYPVVHGGAFQGCSRMQ
jgi:hypothetical protein